MTVRGVLAPLSGVNFVGMRFARDLSRAKARRRRFGQRHALMPLLLGREEPLPLADASRGLALTLEELAEFDGRPLPDSDERARLFLAVRGRIYDVSGGATFYGPGRSYHKLVGKDATRAFCTGCLEPACLIASIKGLSEAQVREADRWVELYEHHDKYKLVGAVRPPPPPLRGEEYDLPAQGAEQGAEEEEPYSEDERVELAQYFEGSRKWKPFRLR
jgi:predicted heme/steroid binding protein